MKHIDPEKMQKYAQGLLNKKESHDLEKHLLDCDLCNEAMEGVEGFVGKGGFKTDVDLLKHRIQQQTSGRKGSSFPFRELALAASVLVIVGLGLFYLNTEVQSDQAEMKLAELETSENEEAPEPNRTFKSSSDSLNNLESFNSENATIAEVPEIETEPKNNEVLDYKVEKSAELTENLPREDEDLSELSDSFFEENSDEVPALASGAVSETDEKVRDTEDLEMNEKKEIAQSSRSQRSIPENTETSEERLAEKSKTVSSASEPSPTGGMKKFNRYLSRSLNYPSEARKNNVSGRVIVSFMVSEDGTLSNFKIIKGLGYGCDQEAIRLIKEGPSWEAGTENEKRVKKNKEIGIDFPSK